ncbi:MAG: GMP synthase (glutamine-hydrolysing) [Parcubacteria group bacterium Gr01-1014_30]|nr:MAG: GMP synthase (glutamine-hydrolysing) [Parcubacteria group bacterium Gr01-1014_30]
MPKVVIIELGSQYTLLIERALRELGFRSVILEPKRVVEWLLVNSPKAVILSGGSASCYDKDAPQPPHQILVWGQAAKSGSAVLGICYGMQWLAWRLRGKVKAVLKKKEYGESSIRILEKPNGIFSGTPENQKVWMSHGDSVTKLPPGFKAVARSSSGAIAAMQKGNIWGVQFHPEVTHTPFGKTIIQNFLRFAQCEKDWKPSSIIESIRQAAMEQLGKNKAVFGFSGGVDSSTVAAIMAPALKRNLLAVTIDGGHLREKELIEVRRHAKAARVNLRIIDAKSRFNKVMAHSVDAEEKRKCFKKIYLLLLTKAARDFGAKAILQGTLASDRIESGATGGAAIKSHHNVGLGMKGLLSLHPVSHLFKYEVRVLAKAIRLPKSVWARQPFPGPGLFLRVVGVPATLKNLDIARWADARTREILERRGIYQNLSQLVVAYIGIPTVGVKGDARVYGGAILVRAVETSDFMTAKGVHFSEEVEEEISSALTRRPEVVRVWFDPTKKPPSTVELE